MDVLATSSTASSEYGDDHAIASFVLKLRNAVDDPKTDNYIMWKEGKDDSIVIWDQDGFQNNVMPKYFKGTKFCSFVRQLNAYGFEHVGVSKGEEYKVFVHPNFSRTHPENMTGIQRRKSVKRQSSESQPFNLSSSKHMDPVISLNPTFIVEDCDEEVMESDSSSKLASSNSTINVLSQEVFRLRNLENQNSVKLKETQDQLSTTRFRFKQAVNTLSDIQELVLHKGSTKDIMNKITEFVQSQEIMSKGFPETSKSLAERLKCLDLGENSDSTATSTMSATNCPPINLSPSDGFELLSFLATSDELGLDDLTLREVEQLNLDPSTLNHE